MAKYTRPTDRITVTELKSRLSSQFMPSDPSVDFPPWLWPYIRNAINAGKLKLNSKSKKVTVPNNADISDYSLPVIGYIQLMGISFPGIRLAELPENYFDVVKEALDSKKMNQYGDVDPEDFHDIPRPLWPYVRVKGRLGAILIKVGKVDPENPGDFPPGLWPFI